jgi:hypothetical protein
MPKPSERIFELRDALVAQRVADTMKDSNAEFMMTITGTTKESLAETMKSDPRILTAAVISYLDELLDELLPEES